MSNIIKTVENALDQAEMHYRAVEHKKVVQSNITVKGINYQFIFAEDDDDIIFQLSLGVHAIEKRRSDISELLTRINFRLKFGHFDMDFDDGEIRYVFNRLGGEGVNQDKIFRMLGIASNTVSTFYSAVVLVNEGFDRPADAFKKALARISDDTEDGDDAAKEGAADQRGEAAYLH